MKEIGILKSEGINEETKNIDRKVIRGIIRKDNKYLMIYSSTFNNYFFPGGGVKPCETNGQCLIREVEEETGLLVSNIKGAVGYIDEVKQHNVGEQPFIQRTCYYKCDVDGVGDKHLEAHEKNYIVKWISLDEAIEANEKIDNKPFFIKRELMIMKELMKEKRYARISNCQRV